MPSNFKSLLKSLSKKSNHDQFKHACIVLRGGAIQSIGYNFNATHSEISALNKLWPNKRSGTVVFNLRFTRTGLGNSAPCRDCKVYMIKYGVKQSWYYENGFIVKEKL